MSSAAQVVTTHDVANLEHAVIEFDSDDDPLSELPHYVDSWVPHDEVTLLAGHGGGGKSYVALSIAVHVALGLCFDLLKTKQTNDLEVNRFLILP